jgi:hypothetical protein
MKKRQMMHLALLAFLALTSAAAAQVGGSADWLWDVATDNGDSIVQVGEVATVTLSLDMSPDVDYPNGPVLGLGRVEFDTIGGDNADFGSILAWYVLGDLDLALGDQTTTDAQASLAHSLCSFLSTTSSIPPTRFPCYRSRGRPAYMTTLRSIIRHSRAHYWSGRVYLTRTSFWYPGRRPRPTFDLLSSRVRPQASW